MMNFLRQTAAQRFLDEYDFAKRFALYCAPKRELTEDIVNEAFEIFVSRADNWNLEEDVRPILVRLLRTVAARHWREHYRHAPESLRELAERLRTTAAAATDHPEFFFEREEEERLQNDLKQCIGTLPTRARSLLEMHYWERNTMVDIADSLNLKASTVRQTMARLREKLRLCIERKRAERRAGDARDGKQGGEHE